MPILCISPLWAIFKKFTILNGRCPYFIFNIKILLPQSGYVEIMEEGKPTIEKTFERQLLFPELHPENEIYITLWMPDGFSVSKLKASYENGEVKIIKGLIKENNIVFNFKLSYDSLKFILPLIVGFILWILLGIGKAKK